MIHALTQARRKIRAPIVQWQFRQLLKRTTQAELKKVGVDPIGLRFVGSKDVHAPLDVILRKEQDMIVVAIRHGRPTTILRMLHNRIATHVYYFAQTTPDIREIAVDIGDACDPTAATYRFATTSSHYEPVTDAHFFQNRGYAEISAFSDANPVTWEDRTSDIIWRGDMNGNGIFSLDPARADHPGLIQRLRMALICRDLDIDFQFVPGRGRPFAHVLRTAGLTGDYVPTTTWSTKKFAIDIDGYTSAWSNFMQRLKLGCCVLKVDSPFGYYQWYYHKLRAWEHFVPIRADLSDLQEKLDWVRSNDAKAKEIAAAGQALARTLTFESECQAAVTAIEEREARG